MLNHIVLVGRLTSDPEVYETENGKTVVRFVLAVPRSYKNSEGEYETDFIYCKLWQGLAKNVSEYCKKGDLIGVKGRVETYNYDTENGRRYITEVVADKVTFLSSRKQG